MRYSFLLFITCLSATTAAFAQGYKWGQYIPDDESWTEVSVGYGLYSSDYLFDGNTPGFIGPATITRINENYSGTINASVHYFFGRRIFIGAVILYENGSGVWQENYYTGSRYGAYRRVGTYKRQAFTCAPEIRFIYKRRARHMFYCTAGMGASYQNEVDRYDDEYYLSRFINGKSKLGNSLEQDHNRWHFNMYISPIGFSTGTKVKWFAELGIGYKGIFNTGISLKL